MYYIHAYTNNEYFETMGYTGQQNYLSASEATLEDMGIINLQPQCNTSHQGTNWVPKTWVKQCALHLMPYHATDKIDTIYYAH